ncbi:hypothetical protein GCM10007063_11770 [Lentibacillus kapialis]|uniref:PepSY domain-containing protein n=1 Tax=Lentibacillus kapialis TaxID=340214 RepID=A0A917PTF6_9BACI|nr:PepSY domain-containing protein [Lentibacillus kapialis]GGJ90783.1 hypothetical protein GCM10007063_11770 [Lentibacillus kapialis]
MKRKIGFVLAVMLGISALGLGMLQSSASEASPKMDRQEIKDLINSQYPGDVSELELDKEGTKSVYEAEIHDGNKEYEIKLDGNTGDVMELEEKYTANADKDQNKAENNEEKDNKGDRTGNKTAQADDAKNDSNQDDNERMELSQNNSDNDNKNNKPQKSAAVDKAKAEKIAKDSFSGTITQLELDEDDGRLYYEIEMRSEKKEADIEINAYTGDILVKEVDHDDDDDHDDSDENDDNDDSDDHDDDGDDDADEDNK